MNQIEAVLIDNREPDWIKNLTFGGVPTAVMTLDYGDIHALTTGGHTLVVERKTPEDFLNTLRDERLLPQMTRMVDARLEQQENGNMTVWPYLCITGTLYRGPGGKVHTGERGATGWDWNSVQGALLTIQEMGVFVIQAGDDADFEPAILRLAQRARGPIKLLPPRPPQILGPGAAFLAGLPGVGPEYSMRLLEWGENPAWTLAGITDLGIDCPLPTATRRRVRTMLGLKDGQELEIQVNQSEQEILAVQEGASNVS